ncbi:hypothetical protein GRI38_10680 [Altererythrobacter aurantiacus]|uniref:Uncharacterized protein n=1 Tax=Parapontixanthobacter aurantiacus TaxID=1463599 RepID=A0A844ZLD6_9SPHN|nr:hypothetical protein [Parapontixanthobacter aurantiacus]MXO86489.1 hypothetical protein [Parapontixanthobacter aurantiacus]
MFKEITMTTSAILFAATPVLAQSAQTGQMIEVPAQAVQQAAHTGPVLPASTELTLRMDQEVTTKGRTWKEGDTFHLTNVADVIVDGYVAIPQGARATGRITWLTSRGAFGKSGKMDIAIEHIEVNGKRIPLEGTFRQEGEGATLATIGGVIVAGVFAGFITGRSGRIPHGRELKAFTKEPLKLAVAPVVQPQRVAEAEPVQPAPKQRELPGNLRVVSE